MLEGAVRAIVYYMSALQSKVLALEGGTTSLTQVSMLSRLSVLCLCFVVRMIASVYRVGVCMRAPACLVRCMGCVRLSLCALSVSASFERA